MIKSHGIRFKLQGFRGCTAFLLALAASVILSSSSSQAAGTANGSMEQLQSRLKSSPEKASMKDWENAMKAAVKANPAAAPDYVEAFIKSGRKETAPDGKSDPKDLRDSCEDTGRIVAAAIAALGENPPVDLVTSIVERAVLLEPRCAPAIVAAAVKAAPVNLADEIVETAIASVPNPEQMVGNATLAEAILSAALGARPGLDRNLLIAAANRGLGLNPSIILADAMPSAQGPNARGELNGIAAYQKNPNLPALLVAEREENAPAASRP